VVQLGEYPEEEEKQEEEIDWLSIAVVKPKDNK
jgi:hypothetical protein